MVSALGQEQGVPMESQGAPVEQGLPTQGGLFPKDQQEVKKFAMGIIQMIYKDAKVLKQIIQTITQSSTIDEGIVSVVSMILSKTLLSIYKKTGKDINPKFVEDLILLLTIEMFTILKAAGEMENPPDQKNVEDIVTEVNKQLVSMLQRAMQTDEQQKELDTQGGEQPQEPQGPPQPQAPQSALGGV